MDSLDAFKVLADHADQHHEYIVSKLGQEVVAATIEMDGLGTNALLELDDDEFDLYMASIGDQSRFETGAATADPYTEAWVEFSDRARELFGEIDGYTLSGVDARDMTLDTLVRVPGALSSILRLTIHALSDEMTVVKSRQVIGGDSTGVTELPVEGEDLATVHKALERLAAVNETLRK